MTHIQLDVIILCLEVHVWKKKCFKNEDLTFMRQCFRNDVT